MLRLGPASFMSVHADWEMGLYRNFARDKGGVEWLLGDRQKKSG